MSQSSAAAASTTIVRSTTVLYPPFAAAVERALAAARAAGHDVYAFETYRPPARQAELYAQGRTTKGPIVTHADAWQSWHQFWVATDLAFGGPGAWHWRGDFIAVGAFMAAEGLETLAPFETGHWQKRPAMTLADARRHVAGGGQAALFAAFDRLNN